MLWDTSLPHSGKLKQEMRVILLITLGVSLVLGSRKYNDISQYLDNILMNPGSSNFLYPTYEDDIRPFRTNYLPQYPNPGFPYRPQLPSGMLGCDFITSRINANITNSWQGSSNLLMPPYARVGYLRVLGRSNQKSMLKFNQFIEEDYFPAGSYNIPFSYDVRQRYSYCSSLMQPLHQGCNCRGDWAMSAASAFADRLCIASNGRFNDFLSAQQLLSCCPYCSEGAGCDGGDSMSAWVYFRDHGVVTGSPWMNGRGCQPFGIQACPADAWSQLNVNITMTPTCSQQCYNPQQIMPNPYTPYNPYNQQYNSYYPQNNPYYQSSNAYLNQPLNSFANQPFNSYLNQPLNSYANQPLNSYLPLNQPLSFRSSLPEKSSSKQKFNPFFNQPLNSFANQPFSSYLNQPFNSYANQPFSSYLNQPLNSYANQPFSSYLNQPFNSYANQPFNSYLNQPFNSYPNYPANSYPYQPNSPFPYQGNSYPYQQIFKTSTAFYMKNPSIEQIKREIYLYGPVTADIRVYEDLHCYRSGVYRHMVGDFLGYKTVKLLGWGQSAAGPYWIAANTWGNNWGENGFFKLGMENDLDFTVCAGRVARDFYSANYFRSLMK